MKKPRFAKTAAEAARHLDLKERRITSMLSEGCPGKGSRGYDLDAMREWRRKHVGPLRGAGKRPPSADEEALLEARAALRQAKAELLEHELRVRRGELLETAKVKEFGLAGIHATRRAILDLHYQAAPQIHGLDERGARAILEAHVDAIMRRWTRYPT